jgi:hypothetical protein
MAIHEYDTNSRIRIGELVPKGHHLGKRFMTFDREGEVVHRAVVDNLSEYTNHRMLIIKPAEAGWEGLTNLSWFESDRHGFQSVAYERNATDMQNQPSSTLVSLGIL